jgi:hypothetical protein
MMSSGFFITIQREPDDPDVNGMAKLFGICRALMTTSLTIRLAVKAHHNMLPSSKVSSHSVSATLDAFEETFFGGDALRPWFYPRLHELHG